MASDGCQPVGWKDQGGFPYLMHHPGFTKTENYGSAAHGHASAQEHEEEQPTSSGRGDRTGTWNGPAPRGYAVEPMHAQDESRAAASQPVSDPPHILLPGGTRMPLIGLGTYKMESAESIRTALAVGYRHIDCARVYGNEAVVGEGLKDFLAQGKRGELFITSKVWNDAHRPAELRRSVEASLADLGCQYLDLCLVHWPDAWKPGSDKEPDTEVTLQQTWQAMEALVDDGLARHIGVSNFGLRQIEEVLDFARIKPVVNQVELHPLLAQRKLVGVCLRKGVHSVAYSPLGHRKDNELMTSAAVQEVAQETGKSPAQVLLKWNVQRGVGVIPKAGSEPHLRENIEGLFSWRLTWDQKAKLDALDAGKRFVDSEWHTWEDAEEGGAAKPSRVLAQ